MKVLVIGLGSMGRRRIRLIKKYDPSNENLILVLKLEDGSILNVEASQIHEQYSGSIYFDYTDINGTDRYFIDDDYQDWMIRCGYIVLDDYDIKKITDKNEGIKIRNELTSKIKDKKGKGAGIT